MIFQEELSRSMRVHAQRIAIEYNGTKITYSELLDRSDRVTGALLRAGAQRQQIAGIRLRKKPDLICAIIGTLNAGCVFAPIDPGLPGKRIESMLKDLDPVFMITEDMLAGAYGSPAVPVAYPAYDRDDSVYIYFTSGSTGTPKGIIGKNCSLLQFLQWEIETFGFDHTVRCSQFIHPYFDAFLRDIFIPLLTGGTICIPPDDEDFLSPEKMTAWIDETAVTLIHCVPSVFRVFNSRALTGSHFTHLRYVLLSGEKIAPAELLPWYEVFGTRIQLVNLYGATETTMIRSCYLIRPEDARSSKIPIGSPIRDTELLVLNKDLKPCKTLVPGDLYIVSDYLAKGYLGNPGLTNEKFVRLGVEGGRKKMAFRTGDKARVLADGSIDLIGREDRQVKIRGIRIELDEIEQIIIRSGLARNAVAVRHEDESGNDSLRAFVIRNEERAGTDPGVSLLQYLREYLPAYAIPSAIEEVEEFPLLSNGKINYRELANSVQGASIVGPANAIESKLLAIWKEILGDKPISTEESFHRMGGNSISIMRLIGRIYKEFNVRISLAEMFNNLTIRGQANLIAASGKDNLFVIPKVKEKPFYNVSSAQERIYYNYELNKKRTSYNLPMAWEITGSFDKDKIEGVFRSLIERHEGLRTEFAFHDGKLAQVIKASADFAVEELQAQDQNVYGTVVRFCRPFDLSKAPLFRCGIITTDQGKKIMVVDFHHIICDGVSQMILLSDFSKLYYGGELKPLDIQYKDFAEWEYHFKSTEEYIAHREFWLRSFEGNIPRINFPTLRRSVDDLADKGGNVEFHLPYERVAAFTDHLQKEAITTSSGLFAIYLLFLSQLTGQEDIVVGAASAGRMQQEVENIVGMFVKTLPIRYRIDYGSSFKDFLAGLHNYMVQANSKQIYDLADIVSELNNSRPSGVKNLFDVGFVFLNFAGKKATDGQYDFSEYQFENPNSKSQMILYVREDENAFYCRIEYSQLYFTRADIEMLAEQLRSLADQVNVHIDATVEELIGNQEPSAAIAEDDITFNF